MYGNRKARIYKKYTRNSNKMLLRVINIQAKRARVRETENDENNQKTMNKMATIHTYQ